MEDVFHRNVLCWGAKVQRTLQQSCVLIAGMGGLGCTVAQLLVRSGVGKLIVIDCGTIAATDLNRQVLYTRADLGGRKTAVAAERLRAITGTTEIVALDHRIEATAATRAALAALRFACVADCLDNFESRYALEAALPSRAVMVHGGVYRDFGQVTTIIKDVTTALRQVLGNIVSPAAPLPVCTAVVSLVGTLMAHEITNVLGGGPRLAQQLLIVELSDFSQFKVPLQPPPAQRRTSPAVLRSA